MPHTDPQLERRKRKLLGVDPSIRAIPDTTGIEIADVQKRAARGLRAQRGAASFRLGTRSIEEQIRARGAEETFAQEKFDIAKEQSRIAEAIDFGSLGLSGLKGLDLIREADRQTAMLDELIAEARKNGDVLAEFRLKAIKISKGLG